ncbi:hypothetical protein ACKWTF_012829 [Chironomus riparius]
MEVSHTKTNDPSMIFPVKVVKMKSSLENEVLNKVDRILLNFKYSTRMLREDIYISTYHQNEGIRLQNYFTCMVKSDVAFMEGSRILPEKSIWNRQNVSQDINDQVLFERNNKC